MLSVSLSLLNQQSARKALSVVERIAKRSGGPIDIGPETDCMYYDISFGVNPDGDSVVHTIVVPLTEFSGFNVRNA